MMTSPRTTPARFQFRRPVCVARNDSAPSDGAAHDPPVDPLKAKAVPCRGCEPAQPATKAAEFLVLPPSDQPKQHDSHRTPGGGTEKHLLQQRQNGRGLDREWAQAVREQCAQRAYEQPGEECTNGQRDQRQAHGGGCVMAM